MTKKLDRPIFYLNNDDSKEVRAGGVLFYKKVNGKTELLMVINRGKYEDFGGRTDNIDKDYLDTVSREVDEESNNIFKKDNIRERILKLEPLYVKLSKYVLYIVELESSEQNLDSTIFGNRETHDNIQRIVEYISLDKLIDPNFIKNNLNFRLKNKQLFDLLNKL